MSPRVSIVTNLLREKKSQIILVINKAQKSLKYFHGCLRKVRGVGRI